MKIDGLYCIVSFLFRSSTYKISPCLCAYGFYSNLWNYRYPISINNTTIFLHIYDRIYFLSSIRLLFLSKWWKLRNRFRFFSHHSWQRINLLILYTSRQIMCRMLNFVKNSGIFFFILSLSYVIWYEYIDWRHTHNVEGYLYILDLVNIYSYVKWYYSDDRITHWHDFL